MKRIVISIILICISYICSGQGYRMVSTLMKPAAGQTVIIDPGHGGEDPGKVGINQILEKDINLAIALYLKKYLENDNIHVILTRETDESLSTSTSNHKSSDLSNRKEIIFQNNPAAAISIHQNSYPDTSVHGAQVFYKESHEKSKLLAETLQEYLLQMDSSNHRTAKSEDSYYLFRDNPYATVIAECGFLSNPEEASWLNDPDYQKKIAKHLATGIKKYLKAAK